MIRLSLICFIILIPMWLIQLSEREHNQYNKADTFVSSCIRAGGKVEQNSDTLYCKKNS